MTKQEDNADPVRHLSDADAEAVDRFIEARAEHGAEQKSKPGGGVSSDRLGKVEDLFGILDNCPADDPPDSLLESTLSHIAKFEAQSRLTDQRPAAGNPIPFRFRELIALAAVLLLCASVLWPVLERSRNDARELTCRANLQSTSSAFARYAADHNDFLPRGAVEPNGSWYKVGQQTDESNSAHLYLLVRQNYLQVAMLNCPENENAPSQLSEDSFDWPTYEAVSFSYQNQAQPIKIDERSFMPVLADKNPQFNVENDQFVYLNLADTTNSAMHQGRGQNVLLQDGSVHWTTEPIAPIGPSAGSPAGDLIYKAAGVDEYKGNESPSRPDDAFAVP